MIGMPLWSGLETVQSFTMYQSNSLDAEMEDQPDNSSRLCLGCHDGSDTHLTGGSADLGTDLSRSHPISFVYDSDLANVDSGLKDPSEQSTLGGTITEDLLDPEQKMQCISCHEVHSSGIGDKMMRGYDYDTQGSEFCRMCHLQ